MDAGDYGGASSTVALLPRLNEVSSRRRPAPQKYDGLHKRRSYALHRRPNNRGGGGGGHGGPRSGARRNQTSADTFSTTPALTTHYLPSGAMTRDAGL
jgi:hypothetical protein